MRQAHIFFATFIVNHGVDRLVDSCDKIQKGILFMIMNSEGDKVKHCSAPPRERKYVLIAYADLASQRP